MQDANRSIPGLDGLRAISILCVMVSHTRNVGGEWLPEPIRDALGRMGVQVFFVISGFLITTLLLREHAKSGRIGLKNFYIRRAFRILPAFLVFMGTAALLAWGGVIAYLPRDYARAFTFTSNFGPPFQVFDVGHTWSLSTEEQFYLVWPFLLVCLGFVYSKWVAALFAVFSVIRLLAFKVSPHMNEAYWSWLPNGVDGIAMGCLLAGLHQRLAERRWFQVLRSSPVNWVFWAIPVLTILIAANLKLYFMMGFVSNVALAFIIARTIEPRGQWIDSLLNHRALTFVGVLSYSLYLWQQLFLGHERHGLMFAFPLNWVVAVACALASYYVVERPILRWRKRFHVESVATAPSGR